MGVAIPETDEAAGTNESKAIGGYARARALSPEERREIAKKAALSRWNAEVPQATYEGELQIGSTTVYAAVLPNGKRLLSQSSFLLALGRSRTPKAGTGALNTVDDLPFFLQAEQLKPFISEELRRSTIPIFFRNSKGQRSVGYDALLLPMVCEVYLKFRDYCLEQTRKIPRNYRHIIHACDTIMRGFAHVGIIALVDEATGYQEVRDRNELHRILEAYIAREFLPWTKRFPDEFYKQLFRLQGWQYSPPLLRRPRRVGQLTSMLVYEQLPPGVVEKLREKNPVVYKDHRRKYRHHQFLTENIGNPHLEKHLASITTLMRAAPDWKTFKRLFERAFPQRQTQGELWPQDDSNETEEKGEN